MREDKLIVLPILGLNGLDLRKGAHQSRDEGVCAMEAVAWLAGEGHSDKPQCVCPVIGEFMRSWNDGLPDDGERNRLLKPLLPELIGTRSGPEIEKQRCEILFLWLVRDVTPAALRLAGLDAAAERVSAYPSLKNLRAAATEASKARDAARVAAHPAARAAAHAAARAAAKAAAWDAAWDAAWAAAWAAVKAAAWDAAWDAARDAAWDAAWVAARDAARDAAWAAAWAAVNTKFAPLIAAQQTAAQDLVRQMAALSRGTEAV
jgi:hypothetical protein